MQLTKVNFWNKWMKNGRRPARPPLRFTEVKPMKLKNEVTSGSKLASGLALIICNYYLSIYLIDI